MTRKPTNRDKILESGLRVVHEFGYNGSSVRDIVEAAGVPQGSFSNHFASKESFGLEILDMYFAARQDLMRRTLLDSSQSPLARLRAYVSQLTTAVVEDDMRSGCMLGNMSTDAAQHSDLIRARLAAIYQEVQAALESCLREAKRKKELPASLDIATTAGFINSGLQGAFAVARVERTTKSMEDFASMLFGVVLRC